MLSSNPDFEPEPEQKPTPNTGLKPISAPVLMPYQAAASAAAAEPTIQPSTLVLWIRHAESCSNAVEKLDMTGSKLLGKAREPVLSPKGVMEAYYMGLSIITFFTAEETQNLIGELGLKTNERLKKFYFYCSFLVRTMITMKIISDWFKRSSLNQDYVDPNIRRLCYISEKINPGEERGYFIHNGTQNITTSLKTIVHSNYLNTNDSIRDIGFPIHLKIVGNCCDMPTTTADLPSPPMHAPLCFSQPDDYHNFLEHILPRFKPNSNNMIVSHGKYIHENIHFHLIDSACRTQFHEIHKNLYNDFHTQYPSLQNCNEYLKSLNNFFLTEGNPNEKFSMDYFFDTLAGFTEKRRADAVLTGSSISEVKIVKPNNDIINNKNNVISAIKYRLFWPPPNPQSTDKHPEHHGVYNTEGLMCEYIEDKVFLKIIFEPAELISTLPAAGGVTNVNRRIPQIMTAPDIIQIPPADYQQAQAPPVAIDRRLPIYNCVNPYEDTVSSYFLTRPKFNIEVDGNPRGITFTNFLDSYDSELSRQGIPDGHPYKQSIKLFRKNKDRSGIGKKILETAAAGGTALAVGSTAPVAVAVAAVPATLEVFNTNTVSRAASGAASGIRSVSNWMFGSRQTEPE